MKNRLKAWWCRRREHDWFPPPAITSKLMPITRVCLRCNAHMTDPPTDHPGWERLWKELHEEP